MIPGKKIRVLVVDDSLLARSMITKGLSAHPRIEVVGFAINTLDARQKIPALSPDVVTMDVEMPGQNGIEFLKEYLPTNPIPVILVSSLNLKVFDALAAGAVDFVRKPSTEDTQASFITALAQKALSEEDMSTARKVEPLEEVISSMLERMKLRHIRRLQNGACTLEMGFILNDIITNFERVAAHCSNVALAVLELRYSDLQFHDYTRGVRQGDQPEFRQWLAFYQDKYLVPLSSSEGNG